MWSRAAIRSAPGDSLTQRETPSDDNEVLMISIHMVPDKKLLLQRFQPPLLQFVWAAAIFRSEKHRCCLFHRSIFFDVRDVYSLAE